MPCLVTELAELEEREKQYSAYLDYEADAAIEDRTRDSDDPKELNESRQIEEIFNSLIT